MLRRTTKIVLACSATAVIAFGSASPAGAAPKANAGCAALVSQALAAAGVSGQARSGLAQSGVDAVGGQLRQLGARK
jgi:hypothetical protein